MNHRSGGVVLWLCAGILLWLGTGCADETRQPERDTQTSGYVEPEGERDYTQQEREAFRPSVPRIYW